MPVLHLCHAVTGDSKGPAGHWSMSERLVTAAAGKRFQVIPPVPSLFTLLRPVHTF